jgi:hypothetical protein
LGHLFRFAFRDGKEGHCVSMYVISFFSMPCFFCFS